MITESRTNYVKYLTPNHLRILIIELKFKYFVVFLNKSKRS